MVDNPETFVPALERELAEGLRESDEKPMEPEKILRTARLIGLLARFPREIGAPRIHSVFLKVSKIASDPRLAGASRLRHLTLLITSYLDRLGEYRDPRAIDDVLEQIESVNQASQIAMLRYIGRIVPLPRQVRLTLERMHTSATSSLHNDPQLGRILEQDAAHDDEE